jgi:glycine cleavage system H protein
VTSFLRGAKTCQKCFKYNKEYSNKMVEVRDGLLYTKSHEWVKVEANKARIGITDYAQQSLTDVVFIELPKQGEEIQKGEELSLVESVKSVSEVYSPLSGKILRVNQALSDSPELINKSPYERGWMAEIELSDREELNELLTPNEYKKLIKK